MVFGILSIVLAILTYQSTQDRKVAGTNKRSFPFDLFTTEDLDPLKKRYLDSYWDLQYQPRFTDERQRRLEANLDTQYLLLTGRQGLGKTRECIELFSRLAEQKGEEVTILCAHELFDRPRKADIPADVSPRNIVLFIDEAHLRCQPHNGDNDTYYSDAEARTFHERLSATIRWMDTRFAGRDWRVVLTARDEPALRKRLRLDSAVWETFEEWQLPALHYKARPEFIRATADYFDLTITHDAVEHITQASDGTCAGIITALAREHSQLTDEEEQLTVDRFEEYEFRYPSDWEQRVFERAIAPNLDRRSVFYALSVLYELRFPPYWKLAVDLASRIRPKKRIPWLSKRILERTIKSELWAWMFRYDERLICPAAYIEGKYSPIQCKRKLKESLSYFVRKADKTERRAISIANASNYLAHVLEHPEAAINLLELSIQQKWEHSFLWTTLSEIYDSQGYHDKALSAARSAVAIDPDASKAFITLAYTLSKTGQHSAAIDQARQATTVAPEDDFAWLNYGVVLSKRGLYDQALEALETAKRLNPKNPKIWYSIGVVLDRMNKLDAAIEACEQAVELSPGDANAWHTLGIAYDRNNKPEKAVEALQKARELDSSNTAILVSLTSVLNDLGRETNRLLKVLDSVADSADEWARLSTAYGKSGHPEQAVSAARRALDLDPDHVDALRSLWINLSNLPDREEEALKARERFAEVADSADEWAGLSVAFGRSGHPEQAVSAARRALDLDSDHVDALRSLSINLSNLSDREEEALKARERFAKAAETPDDLARVSTAYGQAGNHKKAISAAQKALDLDPDHVDALRSLWINLSNLPDREEEALKARERFAEVADSADEWANLSKASLRTGCVDTAIRQATQALELNPDLPSAWRTLTKCHNIQDRGEEAINLATKTLKELPQIHQAIIPVIEELMDSLPGRVARLAAECEKANPTNGTYRFLQGVALGKDNNFVNGERLLEEVCEQHPDRANYWYALGRLREDAGWLKKAEVAYRKALEINPNYEKAQSHLEFVIQDNT